VARGPELTRQRLEKSTDSRWGDRQEESPCGLRIGENYLVRERTVKPSSALGSHTCTRILELPVEERSWPCLRSSSEDALRSCRDSELLIVNRHPSCRSCYRTAGRGRAVPYKHGC
jgi:hypothetical protein